MSTESLKTRGRGTLGSFLIVLIIAIMLMAVGAVFGYWYPNGLGVASAMMLTGAGMLLLGALTSDFPKLKYLTTFLVTIGLILIVASIVIFSRIRFNVF